MAKAQRAAPDAALPTGTLTFLFTDIEGSTRLWEAQADSMRTALARHDALVRHAIAAQHGHVFKTAGDAFCAVFVTATDALAAALAAQQALHAEQWPHGAPIKVRMAIHTGAAQLRGSDYFGPPLNQVARLLEAAHGGQSLVSEITRDLCGAQLPPGSALKSLGEHALRDVSRRETVYQLCHPDLPQAFPPLRTLLSVDEAAPSIAVLPFTDLSAERDQEYFTDGLAEELLNVLSKIRGLRVASRTSAFHFKGKDVDIPTIAQKLNVATVLEGSVRKAGKRVRISAQLIEVASDSHLWSQTYDRELDDIFAVQDDIAQSVVGELRAALLGTKPDAATARAEVRTASKGRAHDAEAYRLYLQAKFFEERLTRDDTAKAVRYYEQALAIDPAYALAWAGLARAWSNQGGYSWHPIDEAFANAHGAIDRALALEPDLAEAHAGLGVVRMLYDRDWQGAETSLSRALELAPNDVQVMRATGMVIGMLGRLDQAIDLIRRAAMLDPLSVPVLRALTAACIRAGRLDEAEVAATKALELNPRSGLTNAWMGAVRMGQGRLHEAVRLFENEAHDTFRLHGLAIAHHRLGDTSRSDAALRELVDKHAEGAAFQIAEVHAVRGDIDAAFEWLDRAYDYHDAGLGMSKVSPLLRGLHDDSRWRPWLRRVGLGESSSGS
jgi:TolB-like protein/class 3 adenylate cyclase/Tfp pilus assembly protein PilF